MAKRRIAKAVGPGSPNTDSAAAVRALTDADVRRAVSTQVRRANAKLQNQLPALIRDAVQTTISSVTQSGWLGPQQPVAPMGIPAEEPEVRTWDYQPGYNVNWQPRKYQPYSFAQLLWTAQNFDILAEVIGRREDEVMSVTWELIDDQGVVPQSEHDAIRHALEYPDRIHPFSTWIRMLLHGMYTIDAACVYLHRTISGDIYSLDLIDGSTITPLLGEDGKTPEPPNPAYLQVIHGVPYSLLTGPSGHITALDEHGKPLEAATATRNDLLYCPRNPRPHSPMFGFSQVEQCITSIAIGLKLEQSSLYFWTAGNLPEALIGVPETWTQKQITNFQAYFDSMLRGNVRRRAGSAIFVPAGMKEAYTKDYGFNREQFEWLARMVCAAFHVSNQPYVQAVNRATAQTAQVMQYTEGLQPDLVWLEDVINLIMRVGFRTKLRFAYKTDDQQDIEKQAQADHIDISTGIKTISEVREKRGLQPYPNKLGDDPIFVTTSGVTLLRDLESQSTAATEQAGAKVDAIKNPPQPQLPPSTPRDDKPTPGEPAPSNQEAAQGAKKLLDYGSALHIIKEGETRYLDTGNYLVPFNVNGRPIL